MTDAYGDNKWVRTAAWAKRNRVDLANCTFYTDSVSDRKCVADGPLRCLIKNPTNTCDFRLAVTLNFGCRVPLPLQVAGVCRAARVRLPGLKAAGARAQKRVAGGRVVRSGVVAIHATYFFDSAPPLLSGFS